MIIGAGLTGLIAAHAFPRQQIIESSDEPTDNHKALLRFRSSAVADLVGIPFKPVTVRKGIWMDDKWHSPQIDLANLYSRKVLGKIIDRSIWNLETVTRWIAPETFYEQLIENVNLRIAWGVDYAFSDINTAPIISTAPLYLSAFHTSIKTELPEFQRAPIEVLRFRITGDCRVYQTVYFPSLEHCLYRASITGNLLICEFAGSPYEGNWMVDVEKAFAIYDAEPIESTSQSFGKIAPIDEELRQQYIATLTREKNIFSLGRFATWRNILLDDVVHDISVIRRLITSNEYGRTLWQK